MRFPYFLQTLLPNLPKSVVNIAVRNPFSNIGKNYLKMYSKVKNCLWIPKDAWYEKFAAVKNTIDTLEELINIREGISGCDILNINEVNDLIVFIN